MEQELQLSLADSMRGVSPPPVERSPLKRGPESKIGPIPDTKRPQVSASPSVVLKNMEPVCRAPTPSSGPTGGFAQPLPAAPDASGIPASSQTVHDMIKLSSTTASKQLLKTELFRPTITASNHIPKPPTQGSWAAFGARKFVNPEPNVKVEGSSQATPSVAPGARTKVDCRTQIPPGGYQSSELLPSTDSHDPPYKDSQSQFQVWINKGPVTITEFKSGKGAKCTMGDTVTINYVASDLSQKMWFTGTSEGKIPELTFEIGKEDIPTGR
ncbi:hypothetical protein BC835DRAFT_1415938 [Cytidiella melzeri]|nr:hypothetical protein BC835DRAFT_1415938 [Cytidiella melzeri]